MARLIPPKNANSKRFRPTPRRGVAKALAWQQRWPQGWAGGWPRSGVWLEPWLQLGAGGQALMTVVAALIFSGLIFSGLLVFRSSDQDDLLAQGQRDLAEGRVARALQTLRQLVRQNPNNFEGQLALGKAYLTLGDVDAAQESFNKASHLIHSANLSQSLGSLPLHHTIALALAQSQLKLTEGAFEDAALPLENLLATHASRLSIADRSAIQSTLTDIHQGWGDSLLKPLNHDGNEPTDTLTLRLSNLKEAIAHYQQALQTVQTYTREKALKQKLLALLEQWLEGAPVEGVDALSQSARSKKSKTADSVVKQSPDEAIALLEPLVRWLPEPDLMIRLGDLYLLQVDTASGQLKSANKDASDSPYDMTIGWYRKAYQAAPHGVGVKLAQVLTLRGKAYLKQGKDTLANADFKEADLLLGRTAGDDSLATPSLLYPVAIKTLAITPNVNKEAHTLQPRATVTLVSESHRSLQHLMARVQMMAGSKVLGEWINVVATPQKPLEVDGLPLSKRTWSVQLKEPVSLDLLTSGGSLRVTTSISYDVPEEGQKPSWELKRVQEIRIQPKKVTPPPAASTPPLPETPVMPSTSSSASKPSL